MASPDPFPINLANRQMGEHRHICAFFNSEKERMDTTMPFVKEGIDRGEKAFYIVDPARRPQYIDRLASEGVDVAEAMATGQLEVRPWQDAYLRSGCFDQHAMVQLLQEILDKSREDGYPLARAVGCMEWCLGDHEGVEDVIEYEARLNYLLPMYDAPVVCTYDISKFSADVILGVLQTHPAVIINGILQVNPFYMQPDEFIAQWHAKKAMRAS